MNALSEEIRAQRRARGVIIGNVERPIIGARASEPKDPINARRLADYHARRAGQASAVIQLWR
ncbi:hypothetical protein PRZ61_10680 [Halomonas pacifica]|uniref:hypothetical protein n=1 Tax=Bisbaumannia pacifica TaxID=77098 RepID=UPI002358D057|nr:hypothetical protein [Halomonas pacifica]MDC8803900.1 hypothetical protein [Halomonas pacifica]